MSNETLKNKIDFAVIFTVKHANPNGDPLNGNRPRVTLDDHGEISDVCLKRKIRDRLQADGQTIFVQSDDRCDDGCRTLKARFEKMLEDEKLAKAGKAEIVAAANRRWFDVRAFGQVFAYKPAGGKKGAGKKKDGEEEAEGSDAVSIGIRGPVSVQPAFSVEQVNITSMQITKSASNEGDGSKKTSDTMGMKYSVDAATYVFFGAVNPQLASLTGFSDADAEALKKVLPRLFEGDASSARPEGSMEVKTVFWWKHNCASGQYSSAKVHRTLEVKPDGSYTLSPLAGLAPEEIPGF